MSESGATARTRGSDAAASRASGAERIATAFADSGKRAALMPYLMGGHPDLDTSRACLAAAPRAAPTTTDDLMKRIGADANGFVYAVSLVGTTGERGELPPGLAELVERIRATTEVPVAVGFGISTGEQARAVGGLADGVIVGSRVVRAADEGGADGVREVVADLAAALAL